MQKLRCQLQRNTLGSNQSDWYSMLNNPGGSNRLFANEISAAKTNPNTESQSLLQIYNVTQSGLSTGVTKVGQQLRNGKSILTPATKTIVQKHASKKG